MTTSPSNQAPGTRLPDHLQTLSEQERVSLTNLLDHLAALDAPTRAEQLELWLEQAMHARPHPNHTISILHDNTGEVKQSTLTMATPSGHETADAAGDSLGAEGTPTGNQRPVPLRAGDICGMFRIERELGRGGNGTVFLASRTDELQLKVAIKTLNHLSLSKIEGFRRECRILANLKHPNIAHLIDAGFLPSGQPWLAMEYAEGATLDHYLLHQKPSLEDRLVLFLKICHAVGHAHQNMIIHRDLKPSNIVVQENGEPKLLDFGIALVQADPERPTCQGRDFLLTPDYASPEQMRGQPLTTASDIYSLGVLFYELITGHRPYTMPALHRDDLIAHFETLVIPKPSSLLAQTNMARYKLPRFFADLDHITLKALAKDPAQRYHDMAVLIQEVAAYRENRPLAGRGRQPLYWLHKTLRRNPLPTLFTVLLMGSFLWFGQVQHRQNQLLAREKQTSERVTNFLIAMFQQVDPNRAQHADVRAHEIVENGRRALPHMLADEVQVQANLLQVLGRVYSGLAKTENAVTVLQQALTKVPPGGPAAWSIQCDLISAHLEAGRLQQAGALLAERRAELPADASETLQARLAFLEVRFLFLTGRYLEASDQRAAMVTRQSWLDPIEQFQAWRMSALIRKELGERAAAKDDLQSLLAAQQERFGAVHSAVAWSMLELGDFELEDRAFEHADAHYLRAAKIFSQLYGDDHPYVLQGRLHRAAGDVAQGSPDQGLAQIDAVIAAVEEQHGRFHPILSQAYNERGSALQSLGKYTEAEEAYRTALSVASRLYGEEHYAVIDIRANIGIVLNNMGRNNEAVAFHRNNLELRRKVFGELHPRISDDLNNLAAALAGLGRHEEALGYFEEALAISKAVWGSRHSRVATMLNNLGAVYHMQQNFEKAGATFEEALSLRLQLYGAQHMATLETKLNFTSTLQALGRLDEAETLLRGAADFLLEQFGEQHPYATAALGKLAQLRMQQGDYVEGRDLFERRLAAQRVIFPTENLRTAHSLRNLAVIHGLLGEGEQGLARAEEAAGVMSARLRQDNLSWATLARARADCLLDQGRPAEAVADLQAIHAQLREHHEAKHSALILLNTVLVEAALAAGQNKLAADTVAGLRDHVGSQEGILLFRVLQCLALYAATTGADLADIDTTYQSAFATGDDLWQHPNPFYGKVGLHYVAALLEAGETERAVSQLAKTEPHLARLPERHRDRITWQLFTRYLEKRQQGQILAAADLEPLLTRFGREHYWTKGVLQTLGRHQGRPIASGL